MFKYANKIADERYEKWKTDPSSLPFKYTYGGKEYLGFPFDKKGETTVRDGAKETVTQIFALDEYLQVTVVLTHYYDYGASEFTLWLENVGNGDSKVLEDLRLETFFEGENPIVRGIWGDHQNQYAPFNVKLGCDYYDTQSGRPCHIQFPYQNVEHDNGGVMLVIGWAGRWDAMVKGENGGTRYVARFAMGLQTYLKAGEKIRTPLFFMGEYTVRDEFYATNYWRSWFMKYNIPKADAQGNEIKPFTTVTIAGDTGTDNRDGSISESKDTWKRSIDKLVEEGIKIDFRWFDAGWFPAPSGRSENSAWEYVGAWEFDEKKWGKDGKDFADMVSYTSKLGMKTLVWFEPERVTMIDELQKRFGYNPEWALPLHPDYFPFQYLYIYNNIANPDCYEWTKNRVFTVLKEKKIDLFRLDFNLNPALAWANQDRKEGLNRWGITECKAVTTYYKFLEEVVACTLSYGGCGFTDSCASGGGRNDLQTLRYAIPFLRSDADRGTTALRLSMSTSFNKWIPFNGATHLEKKAGLECLQDGVVDVYSWRASYLPVMNIFGGRFTQDENYDFDMLRFGLNEWSRLNKYLTKDFYPLTPWKHKTNRSGFTAHAYMDSDTNEGVLLAFRMEDCEESSLSLSLPFAKDGKYLLTDEDTKQEYTVTDGSIEICFENKRQAKLFWVKKIA